MSSFDFLLLTSNAIKGNSRSSTRIFALSTPESNRYNSILDDNIACCQWNKRTNTKFSFSNLMFTHYETPKGLLSISSASGIGIEIVSVEWKEDFWFHCAGCNWKGKPGNHAETGQPYCDTRREYDLLAYQLQFHKSTIIDFHIPCRVHASCSNVVIDRAWAANYTQTLVPHVKVHLFEYWKQNPFLMI